MSDYNLEARKILRKSIKHWCVDILRPFIKGDKIQIKDEKLLWSKSQEIVKCYRYSCPLCAEYVCRIVPGYMNITKPFEKNENGLSVCPLYLYTGHTPCGHINSAWIQFFTNRDEVGTRIMIKELVDCLKAYGG